MVPRLKSRAIPKPAKSLQEPKDGNAVAAATAPSSNRSSSTTAMRAKVRSVTMGRITKNGQRTKRQINSTQFTARDTVAAQNGIERRPKSNAADETTDVEQRPRKTRGRPRGVSKGGGDIGSKSPLDVKIGSRHLTQIDEIPQTQTSQSWNVNEGPQNPENLKPPRGGEMDCRPLEEFAADDTDTASLRRRLDDLSRRYEDLQARHQELRDIGVKAAEVNFQNLKKQTEENSQASHQLILHLREQVAAQSQLEDQVELLRNQLELSQAEANDLRSTLAITNNALSESKNELKTMSVKLAASRSSQSNAKTANTPYKPTAPAAPGNRAHIETLQVYQAKEDLYCDLTGLIVRGIKRGEKEHVYDCIQTGRNGSVHFKLALENAEGNDYEDVQFTYRPQLDEDRDSDVIGMLPEYLTEEITFPRPHASKFYTRVLKALTERVE